MTSIPATPVAPGPRVEAGAARAALVLLLAVSVLFVNPWTLDPFIFPKDAAVQVMTVAFLATLVLIHRHSQVALRVTPLSIPLIGLVLVALISAFSSVELVFSFLEVVHLTLLVILFHVLATPTGAEARVGLVYRTMAAVGFVVAAYGLLQLAGIDPYQTNRRFEAYSFLGNRNFTAEIVALLVPAALALTLLSRNRRGLAGWGAISGLLVVHLAATQARGALLGLTLGLLAAGAFLWLARLAPGEQRPGASRWLVIGGILVLGYGLFLLPPAAFRPREPARELVGERPAGATEHPAGEAGASAPPPQSFIGLPIAEKRLLGPQSLKLRFLLWRGALELIRDHWVLGVGPTNVELVFPARYIPVEYWWPEWIPEPFIHNDVLHVAAELGVPGLALLLALVFLVAILVWRALWADRSLASAVSLAAALAGLVALGTEGLFSFPWHMPAQRFCGVVLAACLVALSGKAPQREIAVSRVSAFFLVAVLAAVVLIGPVRLQASETQVRTAAAALARGERAAAVVARARASTWFPRRDRRDRLVRQAARSVPQYEKAVELFQAELAARPGDPTVRFNLGRALSGAGRVDESAEVFQSLLTARPRDTRLLRAAIDVAVARQRPDEASALYQRLVAEAGCDTEVAFNLAAAHYDRGDRQAARAALRLVVDCKPELAPRVEAWLRQIDR